jgi:putative ABC transport system permease protein
MLKNYLKIILRKFGKQKLYALINIAGLAVGIAASLLIALYLRDELSYDDYHENAARIQRVTRRFAFPNGYNHHFARCPDDWINRLPKEFPEVEALIRFQAFRLVDMQLGENKFRNTRTFVTDANVFDVFSFKLVADDPRTALREPYSLVLTEAMARKYFGEQNPLGREIKLLHEDGAEVHKITGVLQNLPAQSHFQIDFLTSFKNPEARRGWAYVYLLLRSGSDPVALEKKFPSFIDKHEGPQSAANHFLHLQALTDIHLQSQLDREIEPNGDMAYVYIFALIGAFLLVMACINYMNLATARALERAKEIGIRKVLGAARRQLVGYFYGEALLFAGFAALLALLLLEITLPWFNQFSGKALTLNNGFVLAGVGAITLCTALLSGSYPALALSSLQPAGMFKSSARASRLLPSAAMMKQALVVLQFTLSIGLMVCTLASREQFEFIRNQKLGFNKEQTIAIRGLNDAMKARYAAFKNELLQHAGIAGVSAAMEEPSREIKDTGPCYAEGKQEGENATVLDILPVDRDFIAFMKMEMRAGRNFAESAPGQTDYPKLSTFDEVVQYINGSERVYILNETAVRAIGWESAEEALGKQFSWSNSAFSLKRGPIIGVVKDFNFTSLRNQINPTVMIYEPLWFASMLIRLAPQHLENTLAEVAATWHKTFPEYPFEYAFLEDLFAQLYRTEHKLAQLLGVFSFIGIFIAMLGILGLAAFTVERRRKEIGVRKVLGATVPNLMALLSRDFIKLVALANLVAWPLAYFAMNQWLQDFAYRIDLGWWAFALAGGMALLIALLTVSTQAIKAALANPVEALRYE